MPNAKWEPAMQRLWKPITFLVLIFVLAVLSVFAKGRGDGGFLFQAVEVPVFGRVMRLFLLIGCFIAAGGGVTALKNTLAKIRQTNEFAVAVASGKSPDQVFSDDVANITWLSEDLR